MILGIGADIVAIERIGRSLSSPAFRRFTFTESEIVAADAGADRALRFSRLFAGKEAVFKALSMHPDDLVHWNCIEIAEDEAGRPHVHLHREAADSAARSGLRHLELTLSHDNQYARAVAVAEGVESRVDH